MRTEDIRLEPDGITIRGTLSFPPGFQSGTAPLVVLCHGIPRGTPTPGDRGYLPLIERLAGEGFLTAHFNFRGTGGSGGSFELLGWARDLSAVLDYLLKKPEVDPRRIALMGFSGGAAVSIYVAARDPRISAVVSCASPARFDFVGNEDHVVMLMEHFRSIGLIDDFECPVSIREWEEGFAEVAPEEWISRLSPRPVLIVHGTRDDTVPIDHALRLHRQAGEPKELKLVEGGEHRLRESDEAVSFAVNWLKHVFG